MWLTFRWDFHSEMSRVMCVYLKWLLEQKRYFQGKWDKTEFWCDGRRDLLSFLGVSRPQTGTETGSDRRGWICSSNGRDSNKLERFLMSHTMERIPSGSPNLLARTHFHGPSTTFELIILKGTTRIRSRLDEWFPWTVRIGEIRCKEGWVVSSNRL